MILAFKTPYPSLEGRPSPFNLKACPLETPAGIFILILPCNVLISLFVPKTASGGEVSRLMLALKSIFSQVDGVGTLVFDEVDSGISGEVGNMLAEKLVKISKNTQVLCITHLPQVAALSDNFFLVNKQIVDDETVSFVKEIEENDGVKEIARLIGGNNISETALKHALELRARRK